MPSSCFDVVEKTLNKVIELNPSSILDCGVGFGKYGHLCREYLELTKGHYKKSEWVTRIDGVEVYAPYIQEHQLSIYDNIYYHNLNRMPIRWGWLYNTKYDLYLVMDVLEHLERWGDFLDAIPHTGNIILSTPLGEYPQGAVFDNEYERHINTFTCEDMQAFFTNVEVVNSTIWCFKEGRKVDAEIQRSSGQCRYGSVL